MTSTTFPTAFFLKAHFPDLPRTATRLAACDESVYLGIETVTFPVNQYNTA